MANTIPIKKSELLADLAAGLTRKDIQKKYGLSIAGTRNLMKIAKLAHAKPAHAGFEFEDDVTVVAESQPIPSFNTL